jgi:glycosyltransferase involved in cell wall biosynthesis
MKIGIDIRLIGKQRTGDEAVFFNLVKNLGEINSSNRYSLFTDTNPKKNDDLKAEINKLNLKNNFEIISLDSPNRFWWNLWALPNHLRKNPVDVFHTQYIAPFWLPKSPHRRSAGKAEIKLVLTIHDISFNFFPQFIKKSDLFFLKTLIPRSIKRADKIITVSKSEKKNIIEFYKIPPEKVDCAYNGVDFERFNCVYSAEEKERIRKKYSLPEKFLLYIGTLQPRKNIPVVIEALRDLDMPLVLAGNRKARNFDPKVDDAIKKNGLSGKVIFPGWIEEEDKPALLQMAACFVFPSLYEGFGIPVIEAMAAGVPVVCSDIPVLQEIALDAALFCDPKKPEEFSQKIQEILSNEDLKDNLIKKGTEVAKKYTWQKNAQKTLEIYTSLA